MEKQISKKKNYIDYSEIILHLLAVGFNQRQLDIYKVNSLTDKDWDVLFLLANKHDIVALLSDIILENPSIGIPIDVRLKILGMQEIAEQSYYYHLDVLSELLAFFSTHKIPTMVIKGLSLSRYYPVPSHRKCGDIDIYQYGQQSLSDYIISQTFELAIKNTIAGHHTNYQYRNISIENHYQLITTYHGGVTLELEALLEKEASNAKEYEVNLQKVRYPSPTFNAIYLPYHMAVHFRSEKVTMRQVLDWMMFLKKEYENVDWLQVHEVYHRYNLSTFVNAINGVLIHYFGMSESQAYHYKKDERMEFRLLNDIIRVNGDYKEGIINRINHLWFKYIKSGWKFKLFKKNGCITLFKKGFNLLFHHNDYVDKEINVSND